MADDDARFVRDYEPSELEIAAEFLRNWLPFLTRGLCDGCSASLRHRVHSLHPHPEASEIPDEDEAPADDPSASGSVGPGELLSLYEGIEPTGWDELPPPPPLQESPMVRMSWADIAQEEDEFEEGEEEEANLEKSATDGEAGKNKKNKTELSREQREMIRFMNVGRKKDFICLERIKGRLVNIVDGLELHTGIFSAAEQKRIVDFVYQLQEKGRNHELGDHTYSEPPKWMRGKGRVTIQFGCCYNYATDKDGNPPGILKNVVADPVPHLFKVIIRRLVRWHVIPPACIPDSCIVNIYEPGDCIPPHIDSHDFVRPFCTVSFLSECNILFGSNLKIAGPGDFTGSMAIPLPVGSVLVLNANGADVAKHCVPAVPTKRISITFRRMDESKWPIAFKPEADLQNIQPLGYDIGVDELPHRDSTRQVGVESRSSRKGKRTKGRQSKSKSDPNFHESQSPSGDHKMDGVRSQGNVEVPPTTSSSSFDHGGDSIQKIVESKPRSHFRNRHSYQDDANEFVNRLAPDVQNDEESSSINSRGGRRVRLEQHRMIISRNLEGEGDNVPWRNRRSEMAQISELNAQSANNWRRRVKVSLSDGS